MENTNNDNEGVIAFSAFPPILNIGKMNFSKTVIFQVGNSSIFIKKHAYQDG